MLSHDFHLSTFETNEIPPPQNCKKRKISQIYIPSVHNHNTRSNPVEIPPSARARILSRKELPLSKKNPSLFD